MNNENNNSVENTEQTNNLVQNNQPEPQVQPVQDVAPVQNIQPEPQVQPVQDVATVQNIQPEPQVQPIQDVTPVQNIQPEPQVQPVQDVATVHNIQPEPQVQPVQDVATVQNIQPEPQVQPVQDVTPVQNIQPEVKKKKSKLPILIILLLLVAAGIAGYFIVFKKNGKKVIVNKTIDKAYDKLESYFKKVDDTFVIDYKTNIVSLNGEYNLKIDTNYEDLKEILGNTNKITIDYDITADVKNLNGYINFATKENDSDIFNISAMLKDKVFYLKSNVMNDVLKYDLKDSIEWDKINVDKMPDIKRISLTDMAKKYKEYLKNAIKDEYITDEKGTFTIDNEKLKGVKTTITITEKISEEIRKSILNDMKNDKEMIELLSSYTLRNEDEVKKDIDEELKSYDNSKATDKVVTIINIYTTNMGKFLGLEVIDENKTILTAISKNDITTFKSKEYFENTTFKYDEKNKKLFITNEVSKEEKIDMTIQFKDETITITYSSGENKIDIEATRNISKNSIKNKITINGNISEDNNYFKFNSDYNSKLEVVNEVKYFDTTYAKDIKTLPEDYFETTLENALKKLENSVLGRYIKSLGFFETKEYENSEHPIS